MGKKYVIYQRVSTDEQARFGYSLDAMLEKCKHYIASQDGASLVRVYEDRGYSGTLGPDKRPALRSLIDEVGRVSDFDSVLVWKLDRLSRSLRDTLNIEHILRKANKSLESVQERLDTSSAAGRVFFSTVSAFAEFESSVIGERTWNTMSSLVGRKSLGGKPPLGFAFKRNVFEVVEREARVVRLVFEMFLKLKSCSAVARSLTEQGITTSTGKRWAHRQVALILSNPAYLGHRVWARTNRKAGINNPDSMWIVKEGAHKPIVSSEVFQRAQQLRRAR